jgi:CheY-like chemotaxis protein
MNGVIATIQLLQSSNLSDEQRKYVNLLKNSADDLVAIIDSLLDIAKLESGKIELSREAFDLRETVNSIYNNFLIAANQKGLEAGCYLDPNINYDVIGDELRLRQILTNLLSNAVKFTDKGFISFRTKLISSDGYQQKIVFSVKDTGIGIDESYKPFIFQSFSQGDLSKKKKYKGTGLGLAISKQLAELMDGDIHFESEVGKGSTFYFTCTLKKQRNLADHEIVKSSTETKEERRQITSEKVVLCVEDDLINQEIMESIIIKKGYKYLAAYDGNEALEKLKESRVDLILMDIQLPGLNGYELTKIIRDMEYSKRSIPIIAMTAYAMHEDRDKCIEAGMDDYISKPIDIEKLYSILDAYLGN